MITLDHIKVSFGNHCILDNISAELAPYRITAVMGPNGCGKTTLLRCMGGLMNPDEGRVLIDGQLVRNFTARALAQKVAMVRQQAQTDIDFSAFEIVLMGRNPYQKRLQNESKKDWDIVEQCMRQTNTWHLRFARPAEMSGGEMQRVMIARALAQQTPVLLMDEPVSNLDIAHQLEIMRLLRNASEKTVAIVIHDLNLALQFCDNLLLFHDGKLLYNGPIAEGLTPENILTVYGVHSRMTEGRILFDY